MTRVLTDCEPGDELPEPWRVLLWRQEELERGGYPVLAAMELAENRDVDLHQAVELLERGCPVDWALQILT